MDFKTKTIRETKDSSIPLLNIYPKNPKTLHQKDLCIHIFIAALFTTPKIWKQPKCSSIDKWIKKKWYIHTMEHYVAIKTMKS